MEDRKTLENVKSKNVNNAKNIKMGKVNCKNVKTT